MIGDLCEGVEMRCGGQIDKYFLPENELITNKKTFNYPADLIEL